MDKRQIVLKEAAKQGKFKKKNERKAKKNREEILLLKYLFFFKCLLHLNCIFKKKSKLDVFGSVFFIYEKDNVGFWTSVP